LKGLLLATCLALLPAWGLPATGEEPGPQFLLDPPERPVHHHTNRITIDGRALESGWTRLEQCHTNMDALGATQIVFRRQHIRAIEIVSSRNIERARVEGPSVQLDGVRKGAQICLRAETRNLERQADGTVIVRNGPFMRRLFDSYFPLHVTLMVDFPKDRLRFRSMEPTPQPGLAVSQEPGRITIEAWFSGTLRTRLQFAPSGG